MYALLFVHNADESAVLRLALQRAGFASRVTTDLNSSIHNWNQQPSDLILLSFKNGIFLEQIHDIRSETDVPLVVISTAIDEDLHVELLEAGVDLVIFRPYSARLLIAQLRTLLRRSSGASIKSLPSFTLGDITLDPSVRTLAVNDSPPRHLTRLEFRLLYTLMIHSGQVLTTDVLVEQVWGYSGRGDRDLVRGLIKRLRVKVEPEPSEPRYILTVPGVGYKLAI
ncbi:MAG: response regulator transcription factor [Anaerolineales bacterium]|nr:response regulator transcription factor [Anaerolineales bacterium]